MEDFQKVKRRPMSSPKLSVPPSRTDRGCVLPAGGGDHGGRCHALPGAGQDAGQEARLEGDQLPG